MSNELLPDYLEAKVAAHRRALQQITPLLMSDEQRLDALRIAAFTFEQLADHRPLNEREQLFVACAVAELESIFGRAPPDPWQS
jgi:hypothetical protein